MLTEEMKIKNDYVKIEATNYGEGNFKNSLALLYHENSKLSTFSSRTLGIRVQSFNNELYHTRASQPFKHYPGYKVIPMDEFKNLPLPEANLFSTIENRRSGRYYDEEYKMTLQDIFYLLHYSYGISGRARIHNIASGHWCYRNVPSGGALHPLELYMVVFNGEIESGVYHFRADINAIEFLKAGQFYPRIREIITAEPIVNLKEACAVIFITSMFERTMIKYGDRGYRFILEETGFVAQNISLISEAIGFGSCMIGGYLDDKVNDLLDVNGVAETVQNVIILGKKKSNDTKTEMTNH